MESCSLSEGCKDLASQGGALQCYYYPLNRLPASRLLLPLSGLERSDFVPWAPSDAGGISAIALLSGESRHPTNGLEMTRVTQRRHSVLLSRHMQIPAHGASAIEFGKRADFA